MRPVPHLILVALLALVLAADPVAAGWSMSTRTDHPAGGGPEWVHLWDLDNDGLRDIVIANLTTDDVSVMLATGPGTFAPKVDYVTGGGTYTVAVGDLDNDNVGDLLTANYTAGSISVLLGNGDGTFQAKTDFASGAGTAIAATGWLNGDQYMDVVTSNALAHTVSVFFGDGTGGFSPRTDYNVGNNPNWVALGDLDDDQDVDLVTANYGDNTISVLLGNGDGTFQGHVQYPVGAEPLTLALTLLDADRVLDVVTANHTDHTVSVLIGQGDGTFGPATSTSVANGPVTVTAADLDMDGAMDIVASCDAADVISLLPGNGSGGFLARTDHNVGDQPLAVAAGDLDDDGVPDLVTANFASNDVTVLIGSPGGFRVGELAAPLVAHDANNGMRSLADDLGKWVLVDFSAVWCGPCRAVSREVMTVHATWTAAGLPFEYLIALVDGRGWTGSEAIDATRWATSAQITRPVLHESGRNWGPIRAFHRALGLSSYPTFMLVDPTGTIRWLGSGEFDAQYLVDRIAQLAGVPSPPLQVYTPPPPPPPPSVRPEWRAAQGVQMDLDFGGQSGSYTLPLFTAPGRTSSQLYLEGKNGGIGISEPALYQVNCTVDTVEAVEDLEILFGAGPGGSMDLTQPWTVSLSGFQWADGQPRMLEGKVARVCAFYYTDPSMADFSFLCTTISEPATYQDGTLSVAPIPIDNLADLPPLTFAIVLEGLSLRHVNPVLSASGGSAGTLALEPPVPNPAMGPMRLRWTMAAEGEAHLDVLDVAGRVVRVLQSGPAAPGANTTPWDLRDDSGARVAPGLYFVRYRANGETRTTRLAVSR